MWSRKAVVLLIAVAVVLSVGLGIIVASEVTVNKHTVFQANDDEIDDLTGPQTVNFTGVEILENYENPLIDDKLGGIPLGSGAESWSKSNQGRGSESKPGQGPKPKPEEDSDDTDSESESGPGPGPGQGRGTGPGSESDSKSNQGRGPESVPGQGPKPKPKEEDSDGTESEPGSGPESESEPESDSYQDPDPEENSEDTESEQESEPESEPDQELESESVSQLESEPEGNADDTESVPESESEPQSEPDREPEPEFESDLEREENAEDTEPEPEPESEPESEENAEDTEPSSGRSGTSTSSRSGSGSSNSAEPTVTRTETSDAVTLHVDDANGKSVVQSLDLAGPSETDPAISLSTLEIDPADREQFEITVARPTSDPGELPVVPHGEALAYVDLETDLGTNGTTNLSFELDRAAIPDGLGIEDVEVLQYTGGEWTVAGVIHDVDEEDHRVTLPEASPIAVVALDPGSVEIVDADVPADWVRGGYETRAKVTVRNAGDRPATDTLTIVMGGETVAERNVSLGPDETATVDITFEPIDSGAVTLDGSEIGMLTVADGNDGDDENGATEEPATAEDMPGFGPVSIVLALLVVVLAARIRHWAITRRSRP